MNKTLIIIAVVVVLAIGIYMFHGKTKDAFDGLFGSKEDADKKKKEEENIKVVAVPDPTIPAMYPLGYYPSYGVTTFVRGGSGFRRGGRRR